MERNHNVNSGGGYCKLLEHCVCRRLSTKQQHPFREAETHKGKHMCLILKKVDDKSSSKMSTGTANCKPIQEKSD